MKIQAARGIPNQNDRKSGRTPVIVQVVPVLNLPRCTCSIYKQSSSIEFTVYIYIYIYLFIYTYIYIYIVNLIYQDMDQKKQKIIAIGMRTTHKIWWTYIVDDHDICTIFCSVRMTSCPGFIRIGRENNCSMMIVDETMVCMTMSDKYYCCYATFVQVSPTDLIQSSLLVSWSLQITLPKFNIAPEIGLPNRKVVFQPQFSGAMLNFGGVSILAKEVIAIIKDSIESLERSLVFEMMGVATSGANKNIAVSWCTLFPRRDKDHALLDSAARYSGCGLCVALLLGRRLVVGSLGGCRAVLSQARWVSKSWVFGCKKPRSWNNASFLPLKSYYPVPNRKPDFFVFQVAFLKYGEVVKNFGGPYLEDHPT